MYDHLRFRHPFVGAARFAGLCGLVIALLLSTAAEADGASDLVKDAGASLGLGQGLSPVALDRERGSGLHLDQAPVAAESQTTAVILWDEWQRQAGRAPGSGNLPSGITVRLSGETLNGRLAGF